MCWQGETGISLQLTGAESGVVRGIVKFYPTEHSKTSFAPASYSVTGTLLSDGRLLLKPGQWIEKPANLFMGTLDGALSADRTQYTGIVRECGLNRHFAIAREAGDSLPSAAAASSLTPASEDSAGSAAIGVISDADILGTKLGMTPEEVRPLIKSRRLQNYLELSQNLAYPDPVTRVAVTIPNAHILTFMLAATGNRGYGAFGSLDAAFENFSVAFTPVPGGERAVQITHHVGLTNDNALREDNFYEALIRKYGSPAKAERRNQTALWLFGKHSGPPNYCITLGGMQARLDGATKDMKVVEAEAAPDALDLLMRSFPTGALDKVTYFAQEASTCGDAILQVRWGDPNPTAPDTDRIVTEYEIDLFGPSIAADGLGKANVLATQSYNNAQKSLLNHASDQKAPAL